MTHLEKLKELKIDFPDIEALNASTVQERYFKLHYCNLHKYIIDNTPEYKWPERVYMIYHNIDKRPLCPSCGNECHFFNIKVGYGLHCSRKCISKSNLTKIKKEQSSLKKWGVKNPMQSKEIQDKIKQTNLEKYGVENVYQSKEIQDKIKQTNLEKYGVEYALQNDDVKRKLKETCLEKYGVEYISQSKEFKEICKQNSLEKYGVDHPMKSNVIKQNVRKIHKGKYGVEYISQRPDVIKKIAASLRKNHMDKDPNIIGYTDDYQLIIKCPHCDCNKCDKKYFIIPGGIYHDRKRINAELCTNIMPINPLISTYELRLRELLDKYNIDYKFSIRNIISKELDIYIPSHNIAIEFNGVYWHSDKNKENNYHINKYKECQEKGIQLITIWEDQYVNHPEICESIILSKLGIYSEKIHGRKCTIEKVDSKTANDFYINNHLQSKCNASVHYALKYNGKIVAMMSFGKRSLGNNFNNEWELIRYCSKTHINIIGGASRLFNRFIKEYSPKCVVSWSSNDISNGNMYKKLGFEFEKMSSSYWYISSSIKRYHRSNFSKSNLIKKGLIKEDDERSEREITKELGFIRIFDTGQTKWIWKND